MGRSPCCYHSGLTKGHWLPEEDKKLKDYILKHGYVNWKTLPQLAGLNRCSKSCRLRWTNYLHPDVKRGNFSEEEEKQIIQLHSVLGNKWAAIAKQFKGRTDNEIKNYWNTHLRKKLLREGIDPVTHKPRTDLALLNLLSTVNLTNLSTSTPLDINALKLQTEVAQLAKIQLLQSLIQMLSTCSSATSSMNSNNYKNGINGSTPLTNYQLPNNLSNSNPHQLQDFELHDQTINGNTILQQPYSNNNLDVNHIIHGFGDSNPNGLFHVHPTHNTISSPRYTNLAFTNYQNLSEQYLEGLPQGFCEPVEFCAVGNNKSIGNSYSHHRHSSPCSPSFVSCSPEVPNWNTTPGNSSSTGSTHEPCGGEGNLEDIFGYF